MNTQLRERADQLHAAALARYALALDERYQAAVVGRSRQHTQLLRWNTLGLLGSPYHQVNHLEMSEAEHAWLLQVVKMSDGELFTVVSRAMGYHAQAAAEGFSRRNATILNLQAEVKALKAAIENQDEGRLPQNDGSNLGRNKLFKV